MPKRKEDVAAKHRQKMDLDIHHEAWLSNIVVLVVVLVFGVYVLLQHDAMELLAQQMADRLAAVEAQCAAK